MVDKGMACIIGYVTLGFEGRDTESSDNVGETTVKEGGWRIRVPLIFSLLPYSDL